MEVFGNIMLYFAYISETFKKSSLEELKSLDADFRTVKEYREVLIIESEQIGLESKLKDINPIFIYNLLPISGVYDVDEGNYLKTIYGAFKTLKIDKTRKMMVQCFNLNSKRTYSAKDIEVYIGENIEKEGQIIDIEAPQVVAFVIIIDMICYCGSIRSEDMFRSHLDPKRFYKNKFSKTVSRAELKLEEAWDEFGLGTRKGTAIDIGAAPGGWSLVLARKGIKAIAIDSGNLDLGGLSKQNMKVKVADGKISKQDLEENHIIHIKSVYESVIGDILPVSEVGMILVDINSTPDVSVKAIAKFLPLLCKEAMLIMTIKCVTKNVSKYIKIAKEGLAANFDVKSIRYLPANRMEVTLYAVRKIKA